MGSGRLRQEQVSAQGQPWDPPKPPDRAEPLTPGRGAQVLCRLSQHVALPMEGRDSAGPAKWG